MNTSERLLKAKIMLSKANQFPFFAHLLYMMPIVEDKRVPTMGVDGVSLLVNPDFVSKLNDKELHFLLIHECLHIVFGHLWRVGSRDKFLYNIAADFVINSEIQSYNNLQMPKGCLLDPKYKGWFSEQVYADLLKNAKKVNVGDSFDKDSQGNPCRGSHDKWGSKSKAQQKKLERKWQRTVKQAEEMARQKGNLPSELERLIEDMEPKIDWKEILINYIVRSQEDYSFSRPDRRFLSSEFILPSLEEGERLEEVVIGIDTSGSIGHKKLSSFVSEIKGLFKSFDKIKAYIASCDAQVNSWQEMDNFEVPKTLGGGGTSFVPVFEEIKKRGINPCVLLYFTDTYGDFPQNQPEYDTLWLVPSKDYQQVPFGRILKYEI